MVFGRHFDEKATNLSTLREIGTYAPCKGQEGAQVGFTTALEKGDWYVPMYREAQECSPSASRPSKLLQFWGGDERGMQIPETSTCSRSPSRSLPSCLTQWASRWPDGSRGKGVILVARATVGHRRATSTRR